FASDARGRKLVRGFSSLALESTSESPSAASARAQSFVPAAASTSRTVRASSAERDVSRHHASKLRAGKGGFVEVSGFERDSLHPSAARAAKREGTTERRNRVIAYSSVRVKRMARLNDCRTPPQPSPDFGLRYRARERTRMEVESWACRMRPR